MTADSCTKSAILMTDLVISGYDRPAWPIVWVVTHFVQQLLKLSAATLQEIIAAVNFCVSETAICQIKRYNTYPVISALQAM